MAGRRRSARAKRPNRLARVVRPMPLFVAGVAVIVLFLIQQDFLIRVVQVAIFATLAVAAGKRIRWGYFILMVLTITIFNVLTPLGEVLLRLGPLTLTRGALEQGLRKGFAIPGLVFISLFAVQPDLRLPGRFGGLIARVFYYFEHLLEGRRRIRLRGFVQSVDEVLLSVMGEGAVAGAAEASPGVATTPGATAHPGASADSSGATTTPAGWTILFVLVAGCAAVLFV